MPILRPTARLFVLDPEDRILVFQFEDPSVAEPSSPLELLRRGIFWCTPGGGVEPGETHEEAALWKLHEETGITGIELQPCSYTREKSLTIHGDEILCQERYFIARIQETTIFLANHTDLEKTVYRTHRWWTIPELTASTNPIFPESLATLLLSLSHPVNPTPARHSEPVEESLSQSEKL